MSDAIGGGSGGGKDLMGQIFGILDPTGIAGGLAGSISKMVQGGEVSELGKAFLNRVKPFDQTSPTSDAAGGAPGIDSNVTQYLSAQNLGQAMNGYKKDPKPAPANDQRAQTNSQAALASFVAQPQAQVVSQAQTAAAAQSPGSSAAASILSANLLNSAFADQKASDQKAKNETELAMIETVLADFEAFDTQGAFKGGFQDGKFNNGNLQNVIDNTNYSKEIRDAAQYFLDHPELMRKLVIISGGGGGLVTRAGLSEYTKQRLGAGAPAPQPGGTQPGGPQPDGTKPGGPQPGGSPPPVQGAPPPPAQGPHPTACSLDERLSQMGQSLEDKQNELIALYNIPEDKLSDAQKRRIKSLPLELEKASLKFRQMSDVVSNLMKAFHEMSMTSIRHIA